MWDQYEKGGAWVNSCACGQQLIKKQPKSQNPNK